MRFGGDSWFFPVEPGNFVDFPHASAVWRQKSKANQSFRALSRRRPLMAKKEEALAAIGADLDDPQATEVLARFASEEAAFRMTAVLKSSLGVIGRLPR
jgi:hypothetical protein